MTMIASEKPKHKLKDLSLYIHVPFCKKRCNYCDFLTFCGSDELYEPYVQALCFDIIKHAYKFKGHEVKTVFLGGGTPTCLSIQNMGQIIDAIVKNYNLSKGITITTEANPETVDIEYLKSLKHIGFNRMSFGVQSFDDNHLSLINRLHSSQKAIDTVNFAYLAGFKDINIDLIFSLPHQSLADFEKNIDIALSLPITHISTYSLTVEENTPLSKSPHLLSAIAGDELDRQMYYAAKYKLANAGFLHYEISNFAKPSYLCHHNLAYWQRREYMGYGIGAASFVDNCRFKRTDNILSYIRGNFEQQSIENISKSEAMAEYVILGLRLIDGINIEDFKRKFDKDIFEVFGLQFSSEANKQFLDINLPNIRLTTLGLDLSNLFFSQFI